METKERYEEFFAELEKLCEKYSMSLRASGGGNFVYAMAWPVPIAAGDWVTMKADNGAIVSRERALRLLGWAK